jgi:hypothetical protein
MPAQLGWRAPASRGIMLSIFRFVYAMSAALALLDAALIVGSFFIAGRAPQTTSSFVIHTVIACLFAVSGLLLLGVGRHAGRIGRMVRRPEGEHTAGLEESVARLLVNLGLGGMMLLGVLLIMTYAILARINQDFAVFG